MGRISLDLSVPPAATRQVMIQIPIELPHYVEALPNAVNASVIHSRISRDADSTTINMRLALNSSTMSSATLSAPLTACVSPFIQVPKANSWPVGALPFPKLKATSQTDT